MRYRLRPLLIVTTIAVLHGCNSDSASSPEAPDAPRATVGYLATPSCTPCLESQCSVQLRACDVDDACRSVRACRGACTTAECDDECASQLGGDGSPSPSFMESLATCAEWHCSTECPAHPTSVEDVRECSARFDDAYASVTPACTAYRDCACVSCTDEFAGCFDDAACAAIMKCVVESGCVGQLCRAQCNAVAATVGGWNNRAYVALICAQSRCEPCSATEGGTP